MTLRLLMGSAAFCHKRYVTKHSGAGSRGAALRREKSSKVTWVSSGAKDAVQYVRIHAFSSLVVGLTEGDRRAASLPGTHGPVAHGRTRSRAGSALGSHQAGLRDHNSVWAARRRGWLITCLSGDSLACSSTTCSPRLDFHLLTQP